MFHLSKITRGEDGILTVELEYYDTYASGLVDSRQTFTLKERTDGSLFFVNGLKKFIYNNLVTLKGDVRAYNKDISPD